jgi:multidrug resistance protein, MATE family
MKASLPSTIKQRWRHDGGYRQVLGLAIPLILSTGSWSVQTFINRMFLVWHSSDSVAASMPAGMLNFAIMSIFVNTAGYVSTFVAQYHGSGQDSRVGRVTWQALPIAVIGGIFNLFLIPLSPAFFRWVGHDVAVQAEEVAFFSVLCLSALPAVMSTALSGMLSGLGRTRLVMYVTLAGTAVNILFDYLLIFGNGGFPALGIAGAGWSSVIGVTLQTVLYIVVLGTRSYRRLFRTVDWHPDWPAFKRLIRFGLPNGFQFFVSMAAYTTFIMLVGRLGKSELAATNIAFNMSTVAFMPMIGIGITVSVMVGQALGRNDPAGARYGVRSAFDITFVYMAIVAVLFVFFPRLLLWPFQARSEAVSFAAIGDIIVVLLRFVAVYTLFDAFNIVFSSAIKGAGDTKFAMYMIIVLLLGILVIPTFIAVTWLGATVYACWSFASAYVTALGISFFLRYRSGRWQTMRVIDHATPAVVRGPEAPSIEC